jgi:hypothetical protein
MRLWLVGICLLCAGPAHAQKRFIYDADRDTTAQQAATAAKDIASGSLFETMLRNVNTQGKVEVDTTMAELREQTRATLTALRFWYQKDVDPPVPPSAGAGDAITKKFLHDAEECPRTLACVLRELHGQHQEALAGPLVTQVMLDQRIAEIQKKKTALEAELKALKEASQAAQDPLVDQAFALLEGHGDDVLAYAHKIADVGVNFAPDQFKAANKALDEVSKGLDQVMNLYHMIRTIWQSPEEKARTSVAIDPASLRPPTQQTQLLLLAVDQDHISTMARIDARMQLDVTLALSTIVTAQNELTREGLVDPSKPVRSIETTLREAAKAPRPAGMDEVEAREPLRRQMHALHNAAAGIAQMDIAERLANLRRADELRRYSIRRSAEGAKTYDLTIQAAVQRLSAYWKRGVKPTELAQFIFYVTNTVALPWIAAKQE